MFNKITDLSKACILISNDDGIDSYGIKLLENIARTLSTDVWVVAPDSEQSAVAHSLTVRRPLRIIERGEHHFAVDGTPTDSVLLAIRHIMRDHRPDLVLSGINSGVNAGEDVTYSGTVAVAMEATLLGVPAIAFSQKYIGCKHSDDDVSRWEVAAHWTAEVIKKVVRIDWPRNVMINVNFPDVPIEAVNGISVSCQGKRQFPDPLTLREDPHGRQYFWIGGPRLDDPGMAGTDIADIHNGAISVVPLCLDWTAKDVMKDLQAVLSD